MDILSCHEPLDWIIVGGGIHGTHMAIRILSRDKNSSLRIVDPHPRLLSNWRSLTASTKMRV